MLKMKMVRLIAFASTGLLLASGCSLDSWWPAALAGGAIGLLGLGLGT